ncbi:serine protease inhibitor 13 isoform X2 [Bombyx mori]|nr:serine protease inhibitor 13 isoform X2 [Bombyx mori]XP_037870172.1 serine protease inhibitor 13 isoform X2 [Bombyx mori]XP_037870173.1 serine protease inhibitor 13 isoform X2 [Bombyx mori]
MRRKIQFFLCCKLIIGTWCNTMDGVTTKANSSEAQFQPNYLADSVNNFGYKLLLKMMEQNKNENIALSPTGIAGLLAMTLLGSVGSTYDELATSLGFSQDILANRNHHEQFGELLQQLNDNETNSKTLYADAMFVDSQTRIRSVFKDYLTTVYHGEARGVNFTQKNEVKQMINEWVKAQTQAKIEDFLKQSLPEATKVVLLSALYFSGQWASPFIPEYTFKMPFKKPEGEVMADLMLNLGDFDYIFSEKDGLHMIALPYNDSTTVMYALKPRLPMKLSLFDLMKKLDYNKIDELINKMNERKAVVRFPKMDLESNVNLDKALKAVGIKSMFSPDEANFALMIDSSDDKKENEVVIRSRFGHEQSRMLKDALNSLPNPGVYVDSVLHNVKITVNEFGTEAVAATAGILARSAEQFYADSPFYIFIRNEKTKLVTFSAVVYDPTI